MCVGYLLPTAFPKVINMNQEIILIKGIRGYPARFEQVPQCNQLKVVSVFQEESNIPGMSNCKQPEYRSSER